MRNGILSKDQYVHTSQLMNEIYDTIEYCSDEDVNSRFTDSANEFDDFIYEINENNDNWFDFLVPFVKDFEIFRDDLYAMSSLYESKKENKVMKKSIRERFDPPKDWDFEEMVKQYGDEYLSEIASDWEDYLHEMEDIEYYLEKEDIVWVLQRCYYGGVWTKNGFNTKESFNPNESYYVVNAYGNFYSISDYYINDWRKDKIENLDNGEESFYDWCVNNGYFEVEEDDE